MGIFDDDPFEDIVREFFGSGIGRKARNNGGNVIRGEEEDRNIDFIETDEYVYIVFELPGYGEKDISIAIKGNILEIEARKRNGEKMQDYLMQKLSSGIKIRKEIPNFVNPRKFSNSVRNGVLEIKFGKK